MCTIYERHHGLWDHGLKNRIEVRDAWRGKQRREKVVEEMIENALWRMGCFEGCNGQNSARRHVI